MRNHDSELDSAVRRRHPELTRSFNRRASRPQNELKRSSPAGPKAHSVPMSALGGLVGHSCIRVKDVTRTSGGEPAARARGRVVSRRARATYRENGRFEGGFQFAPETQTTSRVAWAAFLQPSRPSGFGSSARSGDQGLFGLRRVPVSPECEFEPRPSDMSALCEALRERGRNPARVRQAPYTRGAPHGALELQDACTVSGRILLEPLIQSLP